MIVDFQIVEADGDVVMRGDSFDEAMAHRRNGAYVWIRVFDPNPGEVRELATTFGLPELAVEDATTAHQRPKLERYDDTLFVVLKPAMYDDAEESITLGEIDLFVGPDFVISVRHGDVGSLDPASRRLAREPELAAHGPPAVLYAVADDVVDRYVPVIRELERDIDQIERQVFDADEQPPTERIYALVREVLDFQRATFSLLRPMEDLANGRIDGVSTELTHSFRDVADHARQTHERAANFRALLDSALQANLALIGLQENRDQRKISAWAAIALVPTIIGGIWGMNVGGIPLAGTPAGFALLAAIMASVSAYLYWRLRRNDWL
ncbi:Magnesium and cobalt transport protein CorA [Euzebya pacifica]|jgi:magnesium transporter|uniref:Magnesium and cobalt transport protein CorA n=2 Tax=Euzebya pacifica TaxID=1608957 RepID=A0A346Y4V1_9ACTN|nr:Magnesium and cobalt transport protein CorA [Euzebya pacifica]